MSGQGVSVRRGTFAAVTIYLARGIQDKFIAGRFNEPKSFETKDPRPVIDRNRSCGFRRAGHADCRPWSVEQASPPDRGNGQLLDHRRRRTVSGSDSDADRAKVVARAYRSGSETGSTGNPCAGCWNALSCLDSAAVFLLVASL